MAFFRHFSSLNGGFHHFKVCLIKLAIQEAMNQTCYISLGCGKSMGINDMICPLFQKWGDMSPPSHLLTSMEVVQLYTVTVVADSVWEDLNYCNTEDVNCDGLS